MLPAAGAPGVCGRGRSPTHPARPFRQGTETAPPADALHQPRASVPSCRRSERQRSNVTRPERGKGGCRREAVGRRTGPRTPATGTHHATAPPEAHGPPVGRRRTPAPDRQPRDNSGRAPRRGRGHATARRGDRPSPGTSSPTPVTEKPSVAPGGRGCVDCSADWCGSGQALGGAGARIGTSPQLRRPARSSP